MTDVDNVCLDEVAFETCMAEPNAQQDICYMASLLPDCDPTGEQEQFIVESEETTQEHSAATETGAKV